MPKSPDKQAPMLVRTKATTTIRKGRVSFASDGDTNEEDRRDESWALSPANRLGLSGIAPPDLNEDDDEHDDDEDVVLVGHYFKERTILSRIHRGMMSDGLSPLKRRGHLRRTLVF